MKNVSLPLVVAVIGAVFTGLLPSAFAVPIVVGQVDDFQGGTTSGWTNLPFQPHTVPLANVDSGGPAGAGDRYLLVTALGGSGIENSPYVLNGTQWAGDYLAGGVNEITMDVLNLGVTDLALRLEFFALGSGGVINHAAYTSTAQTVLSGSPWSSISFAIAPTDLTALAGGTVEGALSNTSYLLLYHQTFPGDFDLGSGSPTAALFGLDNFRAVGPGPDGNGGSGGGGAPVPDAASTAALLSLSLLALALARRKRERPPAAAV